MTFYMASDGFTIIDITQRFMVPGTAIKII